MEMLRDVLCSCMPLLAPVTGKRLDHYFHALNMDGDRDAICV